MRLDKQRIRDLFAMFADLAGPDLEVWDPLCKSAETRIADMLREDVNVTREMERLCMAAAACAYYDYAMLSGGKGGSDNEIRVGDISVKDTGDGFNPAAVRDHFLAAAADLIRLPASFAFRTTGEQP